MKKNSIKYWPKDEKPREKLLRDGEHTLSDVQLLAILLRTGTKGESAVDLAMEIMNKFKSFRNMSHINLKKWEEIKGLGEAKICQIKAAIEIGRRMQEQVLKEKRIKIKNPEDVVKFVLPRMRDLKFEIFKVLHLDAKNRIFEMSEIEQGTINQANPIIRNIFQKAIENFSCCLICVHNHPSGDPQPSQEDIEFTNQLKKSGEILGIKVLDHIIIGDNSYYSFASNRQANFKFKSNDNIL